MIKELTLSQLKKQLVQLERTEVEQLLIDLYKFPNAKEVINLRLLGNDYELGLVARYQKMLDDIFFPKSQAKNFHLVSAKKVIKDFKKIATNDANIIELLLYFVECGTSFTLMYGDIGSSFYLSMETVFNDCVKLFNQQPDASLFIKLKSRIDQLLASVDGQLGWGYFDELTDSYYQIKWLK